MATVIRGEKLISITRGNITAIETINFKENGRYVLNGPTASGKTTVALIPLFKRPGFKRLLLVQPTKANVGSTLSQFRSPFVQDFARSHRNGLYREFPLPTTKYSDANAKFVIMTAEEYISVVDDPSFRSHFAPIIIDEFHLPIQPVVTAVISTRSYNVPYILVSATVGTSSKSVNPPSTMLTSIPRDLRLSVVEGQVTHNFKKSLYNPAKVHAAHPGMMVVVMPSAYHVSCYVDMCHRIGYTPEIIDGRTTDQQFTQILVRTRNKNSVVVITPEVEAGITLPIACLVDCGWTSSITVENGVIYQSVRRTTMEETIQRRNRAGRDRGAVIYYDQAIPKTPPTRDDSVLAANAIVRLSAVGVTPVLAPNIRSEEVFPVLTYLSQNRAKVAVSRTGSPIINVMCLDDHGEENILVGGDADLDEVTRDSLRIFYWKGGYVPAAIFDTTDPNFDPSEFLDRKGCEVVVNSLKDHYSTELGHMGEAERLELLVQNIEVFETEIFNTLSGIMKSKSGRFSIGDRPCKLEEFFDSGDMRFSPVIRAMMKSGKYKFVENNTDTASSWSLMSDDRVIYMNPVDEYMSSGKLDVRKLVMEVVKKLAGMLDVAALAGKGLQCTNLADYRKFATPGHVFFSKYVDAGLPCLVDAKGTKASLFGKFFSG